MNAREIKERVLNNKKPKEYQHIYNNYGEKEMMKQIKYESDHLGNFEKIFTMKQTAKW